MGQCDRHEDGNKGQGRRKSPELDGPPNAVGEETVFGEHVEFLSLSGTPGSQECSHGVELEVEESTDTWGVASWESALKREKNNQSKELKSKAGEHK